MSQIYKIVVAFVFLCEVMSSHHSDLLVFLSNYNNSIHLIRVMRRHDLTQKDNCKDNFGDLWQLRHWLQFWQLRPRIRDNHCYLTSKSDSGQHSQYLRCFFQRDFNPKVPWKHGHSNASREQHRSIFVHLFPQKIKLYDPCFQYFHIQKGINIIILCSSGR